VGSACFITWHERDQRDERDGRGGFPVGVCLTEKNGGRAVRNVVLAFALKLCNPLI